MPDAPVPSSNAPILAHETLYIGIDVGKFRHVAGFVSTSLLNRHERFESCPVVTFEQSLEGFRLLVQRIQTYVPIEQAFVLMEKTGHYHKALEQYLLEMDLSVYLIHIQTRAAGILKSDKRDALGLANHLYNQLEKNIQFGVSTEVARRAVPPSEIAALLRGLIRHRYELMHECTQRKNKLVAICDELFPELTSICKDPNTPSALALRKSFPTPQDVSTASLETLRVARLGHYPSVARLQQLQEMARHTIGVKEPGRQQGLIFEQEQLITELQLLQRHVQAIDMRIATTLGQSREGRILMSIPGIGQIQAATIIAAIGHIDNFENAAKLKSYFGWAPAVFQTGITYDRVRLTNKGTRTIRQTLFLVVANAIQQDCEWRKIYQRLVPLKCAYDERRKEYVGKKKVMGRIAGQITTMIFALLKQDAELLRKTHNGSFPEPILYDPEVHKAHRSGKYKAIKPVTLKGSLIQLPSHTQKIP